MKSAVEKGNKKRWENPPLFYFNVSRLLIIQQLMYDIRWFLSHLVHLELKALNRLQINNLFLCALYRGVTPVSYGEDSRTEAGAKIGKPELIRDINKGVRPELVNVTIAATPFM